MIVLYCTDHDCLLTDHSPVRDGYFCPKGEHWVSRWDLIVEGQLQQMAPG